MAVHASPVDDNAVSDLQEQFRGTLLRPNDDGYDEARTIWNAMIDRTPAVITQCEGVADVIAAVNFGRDHDLPIAVRGGGHNAAGNAVCDDGLVIDLSPMASVRVDPVAQTARVGPGATLGDLDHETLAFGLATPLGFVSETGVAGLTLGGGFGYLSRKYGMTVDNLRSVDVVTAEGELVHASEDEYPDLFWGVRGGGGNFGVVTSFEFDLHEVEPEVLAGLIIHRVEDAPDVIRHWRDFVADVPDELTVWVIVLAAPPASFIPDAYHGSTVVAVLPIYLGDLEEGMALIEPLRELGDPVGDNVEPRSYAAWQQFFDPANASGARNYWKSLNFTEFPDETIDTCLEYGLTRPTPETKLGLVHLGGATTRLPADATAYPHRDAEFVVNITARWDDPEQDDECIGWTQEAHDALAEYSTDGTYVNFISEQAGEEGFAYGENHDRLVEVKTEYDPENLFRLNQNIEPTA
ncbi:FAD linked oxidase domain protein [Haloterrigena turkmenica DSM 5511]|uniref:FAD linked oxidase domain protein n=1 Tax=Haloterrigena turkmenica (strain ATCC 51198 / DSM 5511 / JCM 9101 / NCIMB 13204 / VKM B-1734 / 4k) TaxID=543526 RepID=D2RYL6_HALTV|nr:FAD-binding oxidoreductase [Haloterrigena turkmenica]ADB59917.1 FAD linked oxidase domain protein [Haloterrigena turkmenica DSM 5511]